MSKRALLWHLAWLNLRGHPIRSLLAALGLLIGTASVVALLLSGEMATQAITQRFSGLGVNVLTANLYQSGGDAQQEDGQYGAGLKERVATHPTIVLVAPIMPAYAPLRLHDQVVRAQVVGADEALQSIARLELAEGRFIANIDRSSRFCVIGDALKKRLRAAGMLFPLGQHLRLGEDGCVIVGVLKPWEKSLFVPPNLNEAVILPMQAAHQIDGYAKVSSLVMRFKSNPSLSALQDAVQQKIQSVVHESRVLFSSPESLIRSVRSQKKSLAQLLVVIAGVSLLVGGIGVMNIMLMSVIERRREIGIRLAVGANRSDVRLMFLIEAIVLSGAGGMLGVLCGGLGAYGIAQASHWVFLWIAYPFVLGLSASILTGVFFGLYPAMRAAKLSPVQCLKGS